MPESDLTFEQVYTSCDIILNDKYWAYYDKDFRECFTEIKREISNYSEKPFPDFPHHMLVRQLKGPETWVIEKSSGLIHETAYLSQGIEIFIVKTEAIIHKYKKLKQLVGVSERYSSYYFFIYDGENNFTLLCKELFGRHTNIEYDNQEAIYYMENVEKLEKIDCGGPELQTKNNKSIAKNLERNDKDNEPPESIVFQSNNRAVNASNIGAPFIDGCVIYQNFNLKDSHMLKSKSLRESISKSLNLPSHRVNRDYFIFIPRQLIK